MRSDVHRWRSEIEWFSELSVANKKAAQISKWEETNTATTVNKLSTCRVEFLHVSFLSFNNSTREKHFSFLYDKTQKSRKPLLGISKWGQTDAVIKLFHIWGVGDGVSLLEMTWVLSWRLWKSDQLSLSFLWFLYLPSPLWRVRTFKGASG